jgi:5-methylcytosine-specific restriction endonuclease McrA
MPKPGYEKEIPQRKRKGFYYTCETCGKEFYTTPARVRQSSRNGVMIRFCSIKCRAIGYMGDGNPMWGKTISKEAKERMISNPNRRKFDNSKDNPNFKRFQEKPHSKSTTHRWRKELICKRGAVCEKCGYNEHPEIIEMHHKDCNRKNQTEENLILLCPNCHDSTHFTEKSGKWGQKKTKV